MYGNAIPFSCFHSFSFPLLTAWFCCMLCTSCGLHCELIQFTNLARIQYRKKKIGFSYSELNRLQESSNECWSQWKGGVEPQRGAKIHAEKGKPQFGDNCLLDSLNFAWKHSLTVLVSKSSLDYHSPPIVGKWVHCCRLLPLERKIIQVTDSWLLSLDVY